MNKNKFMVNNIDSESNSVIVEEQIDTESLNKLMDELGIKMSSKNDDVYKLLLWNDEVNSMEYVMECLIKICKLTVEESFTIMMEAHSKGKAVAKKGSYDEMVSMKDALNKMNLEATVEK